jgi:hypothetical protein
MALREFTDAAGSLWRVWDVRPEKMHAPTRAEDHLQSVINGWLAFEPAAGGEKRRLSPIPARWERATESELAGMLEQAQTLLADAGAARRRDAPPPGDTA